MKRILQTLAVIAVFASLATPQTHADTAASDRDFRADTVAELQLALSKVGVNEAGFSSLPDLALIYDAAGSSGTSHGARLRWLQRHSRRVLGDRECPPGRNCEWTRNLQWSDLEPAGWGTDYPWRPSRWARVRRWARGLVTGTIDLHPCPETPQTWGGRMDRAQALHRGLIPLSCHNTLNEGYRYPTAEERQAAEDASVEAGEPEETRTLPASVARGRHGD